MADADPAVILAAKRAAIEALPAVLDDMGCTWERADEAGRAAADAGLSLVGALEAVLKHHRPDNGPVPHCTGCTMRWECPTYRAITAKLTGKEAGDGG